MLVGGMSCLFNLFSFLLLQHSGFRDKAKELLEGKRRDDTNDPTPSGKSTSESVDLWCQEAAVALDPMCVGQDTVEMMEMWFLATLAARGIRVKRETSQLVLQEEDGNLFLKGQASGEEVSINLDEGELTKQMMGEVRRLKERAIEWSGEQSEQGIRSGLRHHLGTLDSDSPMFQMMTQMDWINWNRLKTIVQEVDHAQEHGVTRLSSRTYTLVPILISWRERLVKKYGDVFSDKFPAILAAELHYFMQQSQPELSNLRDHRARYQRQVNTFLQTYGEKIGHGVDALELWRSLATSERLEWGFTEQNVRDFTDAFLRGQVLSMPVPNNVSVGYDPDVMMSQEPEEDDGLEEVEEVPAGDRTRVRNASPADTVVLGWEGQPFLMFTDKGSVQWRQAGTAIVVVSHARIDIAQNLEVIRYLLTQCIYHAQARDTKFSGDPSVPEQRRMERLYNFGDTSPYTVGNKKELHMHKLALQNLSHVETGYGGTAQWLALDAIKEGQVEKAKMCLDQFESLIKNFHPEASEVEKRQILALALAGLGLTLGTSVGTSLYSTWSQAPRIGRLETNLKALVVRTEKMEGILHGSLASEQALLKITSLLMRDMGNTDRKVSALAQHMLMGASVDKGCAMVETTRLAMEVLRKHQMPMNLVDEGKIQSALGRIKDQTQSLDLQPAVLNMQELISLPVMSHLNRVEMDTNQRKKYISDMKAILKARKLKLDYPEIKLDVQCQPGDTACHEATPRAATVLEARVTIPLKHKEDSVYELRVLAGGLVQIKQDVFEMVHDDILMAPLGGSGRDRHSIQVNRQYLTSCVGHDKADRHFCGKPEPSDDQCLKSLADGHNDRTCEKHYRLLDPSKPHVRWISRQDRKLQVWVPLSGVYKLILSCPGKKRYSSQTWTWQAPEDIKGLVHLEAPEFFCAFSVGINEQTATRGFFSPNLGTNMEGSLLGDMAADYARVLQFLEISNNMMELDVNNYPEIANLTLATKQQLNLTLADMRVLKSRPIWDLFDVSQADHKLALIISLLILLILILMATTGTCLCHMKRKKAQESLQRELRLDRDLAVQSDQLGRLQMRPLMANDRLG